MNIFITGGTGYIGNRTVNVALRQGHQVTVLTRSKEKAKELEGKGVRVVIGDLLTDGDWQNAFSEAEYVIHLAAPPTWGKKVTLKVARAYQEGHYQMTVCLLDNTNLQRLKKFVYVAGTSYFGDSGDKEPVTESYRSQPKGWGPYIAPSVDVLSTYVDKGVPIVTAFPGQVYGADSWFPQLFLEPLSQSKPVTRDIIRYFLLFTWKTAPERSCSYWSKDRQGNDIFSLTISRSEARTLRHSAPRRSKDRIKNVTCQHGYAGCCLVPC
ncbi:NAD(P)-dependent oxidoreductase [Paenibacillus mesophilus]|uniref:NAD-dependent epimerase/dehydratase family protein n=1 Tax=Paenibacillus mesophilus TaxID=2582849 RepID=UPI00110F4FCB|nr:NAD(P)-dependent oxidoreductase [Paenibacillus mesophilus]TMV43141.1 NAD(P)-dependent oxidoreductase [Paenibacillus mesophilus]